MRQLRLTSIILCSILLIGTVFFPAQAQEFQPAATALASTFAYQGYLEQSAIPVSGFCDFEFRLYDSLAGAIQIGSTLTRSNVNVIGGIFNVQLDFGATAFAGDDRYLAISTRCPAGGGSYTALTPRQAIMPAPYAGYALRAPWAGLQSVPAGFADGVDNIGTDWTQIGNTGTNPATNFIGTTDNVALEFRVNNLRALRIEPGDFDGPNIIAGSLFNAVTAGVFGATISGGGYLLDTNNEVTSDYGAISGGYSNTANGFASTVSGGTHNTASNQYSTVGGGYSNTADGAYVTVNGGTSNTATQQYTTVGGGYDNNATGISATISGGAHNDAAATDATVGGGANNIASNMRTTVSGGFSNTASGAGSVIGGGGFNTASTEGATIGGGFGHNALGIFATISGGDSNTASGATSVVSGGFINVASAENSTVSGGRENTVSGTAATVGGGHGNNVIGSYATISGGGRSEPNNASTANRVTDNYGTIGGGGNNQAGNNSGTTADRVYATVGGGHTNTASGQYSTISGGSTNTADGIYATIGGGRNNTASNQDATVAGGRQNAATWLYSTVGGGYNNTASAYYATVPGGNSNVASGGYSFAAGWQANATGEGAFVWADSTNAPITSPGNNTFTVRASGGIWLGTTSSPSIPAGRFINTSTGAYLTTGGAWTNASDVNAKENFAPIDRQWVLDTLMQIPVSTWNYITEDDSVRRMGPMAQDFYAAYGLGGSDTSISTIDAQGVTFAAIQALYTTMQEENAALRQQNADLETRIASLEAVVMGGSTAAVSPWAFILLALGGGTAAVVVRRHERRIENGCREFVTKS